MAGAEDLVELPRVRAALLRAGFTRKGIGHLLGPEVGAALARRESVPARRLCAEHAGEPLATLIRLFVLREAVPAAEVGAILPLEIAAAAGLLRAEGAADVLACLELSPLGDDMYAVADFGQSMDAPGPASADHVGGVSRASLSLLDLTMRRPVSNALDLGTGCGVQALHLAGHAERVVATDLVPWALHLARTSAALSEIDLDLRLGAWFDPVGEELFDLIVANPPFVIGDGALEQRVHRSSGTADDGVCRNLVANAPARLAPGGCCQLLANWAHRRGSDWREQVAEWLPAGVDAWVVQQMALDPASYVSTWLQDSGETAGSDYLDRYDRWLTRLEQENIEGIGMGWIVLRRADAAVPIQRIEEWAQPAESPLGPHVAATLDRWEWLRSRGPATVLLTTRLAVAPDVQVASVGAPCSDAPPAMSIRQTAGLRRWRNLDAATAALVRGCTGQLPLRAVLDSITRALNEPADEVQARLLPIVCDLLAEGYLVPVA